MGYVLSGLVFLVIIITLYLGKFEFRILGVYKYVMKLIFVSWDLWILRYGNKKLTLLIVLVRIGEIY